MMFSSYPVMSFIVSDLSSLDACLAYIDPGSGSMLLQIVLAGWAGLLVFLKYARGGIHFWPFSKPSAPESDLPSTDATASQSEQSPTSDDP